jgi:Ser/Thr protein kinase RdoA (MazF antagonist)
MESPNRLTQFSPIFPVADLRRALAHYASLGFTTLAYEGGEEYGFADRDGVGLHLATTDDATQSGSAYLYVEDADALYREWSEPGRGGTTRPPQDTPYLLREGSHRDPDGNLIRFGSPLPDAITHLRSHLERVYGVEVAAIRALDSGVFSVERRHGPAWVARRFPPGRSVSATRGDADILRFLASQGFPAERVAAPDPVSNLDGHSVLVTEFVQPVPRSERMAAIKGSGGLRYIGDLLGQLHALPEGPAATTRPGGAWHHLADGGPTAEIVAAVRKLDGVRDLVPSDQSDLFEQLRADVTALDAGEGLPPALLHPDFVLSNMIASVDQGLMVVDWTGAGRGPRVWSLAFLLFAEGAKNLARIDLVVAGYRRHVELGPEELIRLDTVVRSRPVLLAVWAFCQGRKTLVETVGEVAEVTELAKQVGQRARAAFAAPHR